MCRTNLISTYPVKGKKRTKKVKIKNFYENIQQVRQQKHFRRIINMDYRFMQRG